MTQLIEKRLLQKTALYQLIRDISCFLIHPNLWIRQVCLNVYLIFCVYEYHYYFRNVQEYSVCMLIVLFALGYCGLF